jgi:hypothetical protein
MRSCCCNAATPGLAVRADDLLGRELALVMLAEEGIRRGSARMAQDQWLIGRPGTGERKVGSRDIAKEPT